MNEAVVIKPNRPAVHKCSLPTPTDDLDGAVAQCPKCKTWWVCKSWYAEHAGPAIGWRQVRPWHRKAKSLIRTYRKDTP
jgi:uncharacterized C2H2 Zn-finger protein